MIIGGLKIPLQVTDGRVFIEHATGTDFILQLENVVGGTKKISCSVLLNPNDARQLASLLNSVAEVKELEALAEKAMAP